MTELHGLPSAVLFDLDGTLIDSLPDVTAALNFALGPGNEKELKISDVRSMIGQGAEPMIRLALGLINKPVVSPGKEIVLKRFMGRYVEFPNVLTKIYPGVFEVLDHLRSAKVKLGVCTNKPTLTTEPVVSALGLDKYFDVILCGDQVEYQKPDGAHILDTLRQMGADKNHAVMVGDSDNDIDAARNAKILSIAVSYGYSRQPIESLGADAVINRFYELPDALADIWAGIRRS